MPRIKVTQKTLKGILKDWSNGLKTEDELIYYQNEIEGETAKLNAWEDKMIIDIVPEAVSGFNKIVFKEKL